MEGFGVVGGQSNAGESGGCLGHGGRGSDWTNSDRGRGGPAKVDVLYTCRIKDF